MAGFFDKHSLVNKLLFPAPTPTYGTDTFPRDHLIWIPAIDFSKVNSPPPPNFFAAAPSYEEDERHNEFLFCETGKQIPCVFFNTLNAEFLIIFCHGNGEDLGGSFRFLAVLIDYLKSQGVRVSVLAVEYPGYGLHIGTAHEHGLLDAAQSAYHFARVHMRWPVENLWMWGVSIGTGPSTFIASRFELGGLILMAGYESIRDVVAHLLGKAAQYLISNRFDNKSEIVNVVCPVMMIHGEEDQLIPYEQTLRLFDVCQSEIKLMYRLKLIPPSYLLYRYLPENVGHTNFNIDTDVAQPIIQFINRIKNHRQDVSAFVPNPVVVKLHTAFYDIPIGTQPTTTGTRLSRRRSSLESFMNRFSRRDSNPEFEILEPEHPSEIFDASGPPRVSHHTEVHDLVDQLVAMGFDEVTAEIALRASDNDLGEALERLLSGF